MRREVLVTATTEVTGQVHYVISRENLSVLTHGTLLLGTLLPEGHVWASIEGERVL